MANLHATTWHRLAKSYRCCDWLGNTILWWAVCQQIDGGRGANLAECKLSRCLWTKYNIWYGNVCRPCQGRTRFLSSKLTVCRCSTACTVEAVKENILLDFCTFNFIIESFSFSFCIAIGWQWWSLDDSTAKQTLGCWWNCFLGHQMWWAKSSRHLYSSKQVHKMGHRKLCLLTTLLSLFYASVIIELNCTLNDIFK